MLALSIDRYFAIVHPLRHKLINQQLVPTWLLMLSIGAMVFCAPEYFRLQVDHCLAVNMATCRFSVQEPFVTQTLFSQTDAYSFWYRIIGGLFTYSLVPFIIFTVVTIRIGYQLAAAAKYRRTLTNKRSSGMFEV